VDKLAYQASSKSHANAPAARRACGAGAAGVGLVPRATSFGA